MFYLCVRRCVCRRKTVRVRGLRKVILSQREPERPPADSHQGEAVPLSALRTRFRAQRQTAPAHAHPHG